jgi:23S rRNA (uridine2552-2'-O)-methyltransferase
VPKPRVLHDEFFKKAKAEGYLARSAYKLLEIQEKRKLIRQGDAVIDLGCAPGSWLQVASELVGPHGLVVGLDLQAVEHPIGPNVRTFVADAFAIEPAQALPAGRERVDVLLSDMAPSTSGHGDDALSVRLCRRVLEVASRVLRPGGHLCMKVLEGGEFPELLRECRGLFDDVSATKPRASRDVSKEIFIVGKRYQGGAPRAAERPANVAPPRPAPKAGWGS